MPDHLTFEQFKARLDHWGEQHVPFFFLIDFEQKKPVAIPLDEVDSESIGFDFNGVTNASACEVKSGVDLKVYPETHSTFQSRFEQVMNGLERGDSYLANLTIRTRIELDRTLDELFHLAQARYKLRYKNEFLAFSPESFIRIDDNRIVAFPMKGTIDATLPNAESLVLNDSKELAEHVTIVDLIRNDLSTVARDVQVNRFRYIEKILAKGKPLLQVSSEIRGDIEPALQRKFGTILSRLLPAGSVSGAPKEKTVQIIRQAEGEDRGYYTGVAGIFDGTIFDSGVMIRFIEHSGGRYFYRSGGGITTQSDLDKEYREALDKIYVPVN